MWQAWEIDSDYKVDNDRKREIAESKKPLKRNRIKKKKPETVRQKRQWLWEFSKKIVVLVAIAFFITLAYTFIFMLIKPEAAATSSVSSIFSDMTNVFKWTVVAYAVKAGFENVCKIVTTSEEEDE